jgi:DNA (cytosine-5)-methyltransferase 1
MMSLRTTALFAGIGGIELGMRKAGHQTIAMCEIEPGARAVLAERFPDVGAVHDDIRTLASLPSDTELLTAGFPCQDLSQAGKTAGIAGHRSGLVGEVFRLLRDHRAPWVLIENVPFMLQLAKGRALDVIMDELERLGYSWAYRIIDSRAFGLPQRRERVYILASNAADPRAVLLSSDAGAPKTKPWLPGQSFGFYWTEGIRGLGAAIEAIPTLKGGSTIGIPSSPAILFPDGEIGTPDIRDAERMQGFPVAWTQPAETAVRSSFRWKLVGNSVTVNVAEWIGRRLTESEPYDDSRDRALTRGVAWPRAGWSIGGKRLESEVSAWPVRERCKPVESFLRYPVKPLSVKATAGFLERAQVSRLRFPPGFLPAVEAHLKRVLASAPSRPRRSRRAS